MYQLFIHRENDPDSCTYTEIKYVGAETFEEFKKVIHPEIVDSYTQYHQYSREYSHIVNFCGVASTACGGHLNEDCPESMQFDNASKEIQDMHIEIKKYCKEIEESIAEKFKQEAVAKARKANEERLRKERENDLAEFNRLKLKYGK